ncbi:hypothetical protein [Actinoplanes sp. NPDC049802]|uniref:hypothetical protein n=1 Tax=Actinoplanes sp. NPDC049802 TaxID=3154742 RepID=UPI00340FBB60
MNSETVFECGHEHPQRTDGFSGFEDGLVAHEAGHVLYRHGEYGTALKCMEFAMDRGIVWADDDVAVIAETVGRNGDDDVSCLGEAVTRQPARSGAGPRVTIALLAAAALAGIFVLGSEIGDGPAERPTAPGTERLDALVLLPAPDASPQRVTMVRVRPSAAKFSPAPRPAGRPAEREPMDGTAVMLRGPNRKGGISTAFVPRERGTKANESRMRWPRVSSSRLVTTLQSAADAACLWEFHTDDGPQPEYRSSAIAVEPGTAKRIEVPLSQSPNLTAVAKTDASEGGCLMVDPRFEKDRQKDGSRPRPLSTAEDRWRPSTPPAASSTPRASARHENPPTDDEERDGN